MKPRIIILRTLRNKYLLAGLAFSAWILFFDKDDLFAQREKRSQLQKMEESKQFFKEQIEADRKFAGDLKNNPAAIEQFAREEYGMKRENEDLFVVVPVEK